MFGKKWYAGGISSAVLDWIAAAGICFCLIGAYIKLEYYQIMINYMPLISVFILALLFYNHVNWIEALKAKDWKLMVVIGGVLLEMVNIKLSHSGYGVILNITSFFLILYLADKVKINEYCYYAISLVCLGCMACWVGKSENQYNTNMASMIIFILSAGSMTGAGLLLKRVGHENLCRWIMLLFTFFAAYLSWELKARGILMGIAIFWVISLCIPKAAWKVKWLYRIAVILLISAGLFLPLGYVWAWKAEAVENSVWMGKNLYTYREHIWLQFFEAFQKEPWTGIGSDIPAKIPEARFLEAHNGYLHILFVYGIIIFALVAVLWICVFWKAQENGKNSAVVRQNIYLAVALMVPTISENYIVLPAYNLIFFLVLTGFYREIERIKIQQ